MRPETCVKTRSAAVLGAAIGVIVSAAGCGGERPSDTASGRKPAAAHDSSPAAGEFDDTRPPAETAVEALQRVVEGFRSGRGVAIWEFFPPGHRQDVNVLVREYGRRMDPELWQRLRTVARKLAILLRERRDDILAWPPIAGDELQGGLPMGFGEANWSIAVEALQSLSAAELDDLREFDGRRVFARLDADGLELVRRLAVLLPEENPLSRLEDLLAGARIERVAGEGDTARVRIAPIDGEAREFDFVRIDGHWFPAAWQETWGPAIESARARVEAALSNDALAAARQDLLPRLNALEASIDRLAAAGDRAEFHELLDRELLPVLAGGSTPPMAVAGDDAERNRPSVPPSGARNRSVFVQFESQLSPEAEDAVSAALLAAADGGDGIVFALPSAEGTRFEVSPVADPATFARRLTFGRVFSVDAEQRTIRMAVGAGDE